LVIGLLVIGYWLLVFTRRSLFGGGGMVYKTLISMVLLKNMT